MKASNIHNNGKSVLSKIKYYVYLKTADPAHEFDGDLEETIKADLTKSVIGLNQISLDTPIKNELFVKVNRFLNNKSQNLLFLFNLGFGFGL